MSPTELKAFTDDCIVNAQASIKQRFITSAHGVEVLIGTNQKAALDGLDSFSASPVDDDPTAFHYKDAVIRVVERPNHFSCNIVNAKADIQPSTLGQDQTT